jgi:hypothetical protein
MAVIYIYIHIQIKINKLKKALLFAIEENSLELSAQKINSFVASETYISFQVRWDNSIPLFLHAAIYLEVSLFR